MNGFSEEEKRGLRAALEVYRVKHQKQLLELRDIDFVITHLLEEWRKTNPWEYEEEIARIEAARTTIGEKETRSAATKH